MSDLRSGGRTLSFEVLTTTDSFFDDEDEPFLLRSDSGQGDTNRKKRKNKKKKKKKNKVTNDDEVELLNTTSSSNGFIINSNCGSVVETTTTTTTAVVYEEAAFEEKRVYPPVISNSSVRETPELRQRSPNNNSVVFDTQMYRIDENLKEVDDTSSCSRTGSDFDTELMMKQTAEINHHRILETDKSLDWKQLMADKDPNCEHHLILILYIFSS